MNEPSSGKIDFHEFRRVLLLAPNLNTRALFDYWREAVQLDLGEAAQLPQETDAEHVLKSLGAGGIAGAFSRTSTAPLDRLKTLLQASEPGKPSRYSSVGQAFRIIHAEEGLKGFFKGNGTNVLKIAPETAVKFYCYDLLKHKIASDPHNVTMPERFVAGGSAGAIAQIMIYPLEIAKTRAAIAPPGTEKSIGGTLAGVYKEGGARALYRGLAPSLCGMVPYAGVDLAVYSLLKDMYAERNPGRDPSPLTLLTCGATASISGQLIAYPLQLVRTRLQAQGSDAGGVKYKGMGDCFQRTIRADGVLGLYRGVRHRPSRSSIAGLLPNFLKSVPAVSISYVVFEQCKKTFGLS